MKIFEEFFAYYRYGNVNGYVRFHTDPNATYQDLAPSKDGLVKLHYDILSVNGNTDKMTVGSIFPAEYNPISGFILPWSHMSWNFERIFDNDMIKNCRDLADAIDEQLEEAYKYVHIFVPDNRKGWSPYRLCGKVLDRDDAVIKVLIRPQSDIISSDVECIVDRASDACRMATIMRASELKQARELDIGDAHDVSVLSASDLSAYINIKQRAAV